MKTPSTEAGSLRAPDLDSADLASRSKLDRTGWTSFAEQAPEWDTYVLVWGANMRVYGRFGAHVAMMDGDDGNEDFLGWTTEGGQRIEHVHYWMPLPEPHPSAKRGMAPLGKRSENAAVHRESEQTKSTESEVAALSAASPLPEPAERCQHGVRWYNRCDACDQAEASSRGAVQRQDGDTEPALLRDFKGTTEDALRMALQMLYADTADYITRNNLGGMNNHAMRLAREALSASRLSPADSRSDDQKTPEPDGQEKPLRMGEQP